MVWHLSRTPHRYDTDRILISTAFTPAPEQDHWVTFAFLGNSARCWQRQSVPISSSVEISKKKHSVRTLAQLTNRTSTSELAWTKYNSIFTVGELAPDITAAEANIRRRLVHRVCPLKVNITWEDEGNQPFGTGSRYGLTGCAASGSARRSEVGGMDEGQGKLEVGVLWSSGIP